MNALTAPTAIVGTVIVPEPALPCEVCGTTTAEAGHVRYADGNWYCGYVGDWLARSAGVATEDVLVCAPGTRNVTPRHPRGSGRLPAPRHPR